MVGGGCVAVATELRRGGVNWLSRGQSGWPFEGVSYLADDNFELRDRRGRRIVVVDVDGEGRLDGIEVEKSVSRLEQSRSRMLT